MKIGILGRPGTVLFVVCLALAASGCTESPAAKSAKYLSAGKKLLEKHDAARAILQFRNAVRVTPQDPEAVYQLAEAYLAAGDLRNGIAALRKTLEMNSKHARARLRMAELYASVDDPKLLSNAKEQFNDLLLDTPNDPDALHALGLTELKLGEFQNAARHFEIALAAVPQKLAFAVALAKTKLLQGDAKGAEDILRKSCEDSPKSAEARVVLGRYYRAQGKAPEAQQQFEAAMALDPNHPAALLNEALLLKETGKKPEAEQVFQRLAGLSDNTYRHAYALFLYEDGRTAESIRELERLAKLDPEDRAARTRLIVAYKALNRQPDAEKLLAATLKKNPKDLDALLQRAELYVGAKNYADAEADLNRVIRFKPDSAEAHYTLSKLHQARGEQLQQRQELSQALNYNPYLLPVRLELARLLISAKAGSAALELLDATPDNQKPEVLIDRNWALWISGDLGAMRKGIDQALANGRTSDALIQDGLWKLNQGNPNGARAALEEALKINPQDLRALEGLTRTFAAQKQSAAAVQRIKEYAAKQPNSAPVQEFLGLLLWANQDVPQARKAFAAAKAADPGFQRAELSLIQMDVVEKNWDSAEKKLKDVAAADKNNARVHLWLGNLQERRGDHKSALEQFRRVVELEPNNPDGLNNMAYLLTEHANQLDEALKYAQKAQELAPDDPDAADTVGWILYRKGLYPAAVQQLERAAAKENNVVWKYHLAMAYAKSGDVSKGRTILQAAMKRNPNVPEAAMAKQLFEDAK